MSEKKIIIVDDEPCGLRGFRGIIGNHLRTKDINNVTIECFENADDAIRSITNAVKGGIAFVLTDLKLYKGEYDPDNKNNGVEVARAAMKCDIPVVVCSGETNESSDLLAKLRALDPNIVVLQKPVSSERLRALVDQFINP